MDQPPKITLRARQDVVDHFLGRRDLVIGVVPRALDKFQQVERRGVASLPNTASTLAIRSA